MPLIAQRALVVANEDSLQENSDLLAGLERLRAAGMTLTLIDAVPADGMERLFDSHQAGHDLAIIGGGDGTLSAAASSLVRHGLPLAILPLGTANDLARTLGIPLNLEGAIDVVLNGRLHEIDLGEVNGRPFFNVASLGLGAAVQRFHRGERKRRWKVFSYIFSVVDAFRVTRSFRAKIISDGELYQIRCIHIAVGNGRHYGGGMTIAEDAAIDDGALDLYVLRPQRLAELLMLAPLLRWGWHGRSERTMALRGRHITIETSKPREINADGEIVTRTPADFSITPKALKVVVPQDYASQGHAESGHAA